MKKSGFKAMSINNVTCSLAFRRALLTRRGELGSCRAPGYLIGMPKEACVTWECLSLRSVLISKRLRTAAVESLTGPLLALQREKLKRSRETGVLPKVTQLVLGDSIFTSSLSID